MTTIRTQDLSGEALDWAFCYTQIIREVIGARRNQRPLRADHAEARERIKTASPVPLDAEQVLALITAHRLAVFEDGEWYALPSAEIASWRRDLDGEEMLAMVAEEDTVSASTLPEVVKKCVVRMTLGDHVDIPKTL